MTEFQETQHPREPDGKFAPKATPEAAGGLSALTDALPGTQVAAARVVLRGYGIGAGALSRLDDEEAASVADEVTQRCESLPFIRHPASHARSCASTSTGAARTSPPRSPSSARTRS